MAVSGLPAFGQQPSSSAQQGTDVLRNPPVPVLQAEAAAQGSGLKSRVGRMFTGAVVGGWLGYFASQVVVSDWEAARNSAVGNNRGTWAAAGVLSGAIVGRLVNPGSAVAAAPIDMSRGRAILTREAIAESGVTNAYELVRSLRPEWLQPRGVNSFTEVTRGVADDSGINLVPGEDRIIVYLDNVAVGGTSTLRDFHLSDVAQMEFIDGPQATFRWGAGHAHGVIQITTRSANDR